jgi:hypothetical protein
LLYQAFILRLTNNFVAFPHLYDPDSRAVFELGTLVMDGRHFTFCVNVRDPEQHKVRVATASLFVLYAKVYGRPADANGVRPIVRHIAVPVTAGVVGNLVVGKRGVFYDLGGVEHDAEVIAIVRSPVSIRSALARPFQRVAEAVGSRIDAMSSEAEERLRTATTDTVNVVASTPSGAAVSSGQTAGAATVSGQSPQQSRFGGLTIPGLLAGGGVAIAAVGTGFAYLTSTLSRIPWWHIAIGVGALVLAVLIPTYISALRKIRRRDLSSILEASGWAINARMRLTRRQSRTFTVRPSRRRSRPG